MNIQIFGKNKCFDTKKALRYFKERGIKVQLIEVDKFGMSKGELQNVKRAVGGLEALIDTGAKEYRSSVLAYLGDDLSREEKLLETPSFFRTPIVRNGRQATVGYCPDQWKTWA